MAAQEGANEMSLEDLGLSTRWVNALTKADLKTAQDVLDTLTQGEKVFLSIHDIGEKALKEVREQLAEKGLLVLKDEEAEVEQERQAQGKAEQVRAEAERALAEARRATRAEAENTDLPPTTPGEKAEEQPVSFHVRLTVDEQGKPLRTQIQPVKQDIKAGKHLGLNGQKLATYMERYISSLVTPEPTIPPARPPAEVEAPTPEPLEPAVSLTVSDVQVFRAGVPNVAALVLNPDEAFVVQARFRLSPEALSLTAQESAFQVRVLARELTSGTSTLLATHKGSLARDVLEYPVKTQAPGLSPGLYRLLTLVRLQAPINMLGHYERPIIRVTGVQPSVNPAVPLESTLAQ